MLLATDRRAQWRPEPVIPPEVPRESLQTWKDAVRRVEEDRRERVGGRVVVPVPAELLHYDDRRRFLAVQVAETRQRDFTLPMDDVDLAQLARANELVEIPPVGATYVLYGVGAMASGEPFSHYDRESGLDIPLYRDYLGFQQADDELEATVGKLDDRQARLQADRARLAKGAVARRRSLSAQIASTEQEKDALIRRQERVASLYEDYDTRRFLARKLRLLEYTARKFDPDWDLEDATGRRALRGRLLSLVRPQARDALLEIAQSYQASFNRPLPVTSLVRSQRYQERLRKTNPNATNIDSPPHATGLAFDIYTGHMAAVEQAHLLSTIAKLEQDGRVEALFERNRQHVHVFVFAEGARPAETLIAESLERIGPPALPRRRPARAGKAATAVAAAPKASLPGLPAIR